ncbi:indolepyruvate ferredoxin oxidoreductase [Nitrospirillum iridis]|uniref:Indolepyruvate ferredoxin oxidoreductase n=2 Tax=Nitrospirillum iridis TaxID=765888 RepID=A0A7X0AY04_9PROT|nr:indolepyruvate ferredoxin oxidoreductase [Nitrospirillum iridis]
MADTNLVTLDDKYQLNQGRALVSGRQALVRLPIIQRALDRRLGLNTAGYISGYRGSPLGGYDAELWKAADFLKANDIIFEPGLNEDLALTAVAGTQQLDFVPGRRFDGVFGFWYGKGPGVDRSGDAIKHANLQGTAPAGGVVLIFGDDHAGKSSTTAHQSDLTLASWEVPVLYPASVADILELGLAAVAMSRFSGLLVGLKLVNETAEATGVLDMTPPPAFATPDMPTPAGGVHIRPEALAMQQQDVRLLRHKLPRAQAFARANRLDRVTFGSTSPRFLVATSGKAYADVLAALALLGLDDAAAQRLGLGVYKIALVFPLDPDGLDVASQAADEIFFVEEKRAHAELQAKLHFFGRGTRPRISGKATPDGMPLLPADLPLNEATVAAALADRLQASLADIDAVVPGFASAVDKVRALVARPVAPPATVRRPAFCPGCPHNTSTKVPAGSVGATGIGCHGMAVFHPERNPIPMGHMGAEGASWIGLSKYTDTAHIFQNLGDGTYNHSGSLAIRAAVQAKATLTYKILFNDAVAMTGGQPVEGGLTVSRIVQQVRAEGVGRVVVVSDDPDRFTAEPLPSATELRHRDDLAAVQEDLRREKGVSVLIYDQVCAAEKRRRRKAGTFPEPDRRVFINALVCEGCGDCSTQSNCMAVQPLETDLGRKRKIDQSACNKDFSCLKGFCPSFVTIEGGRPRRSATAVADMPLPPPPVLPDLGDRFDMVIAGIGGTGVVTVSAILGMAARIAGLGVSLFDMTGLSQKGGAVFSHVRFSRDVAETLAAKVGPGQADLVLACDLIAAVQPECLSTVAPGTLIAGNADMTATAAFQVHRDQTIDQGRLTAVLAAAAGDEVRLVPATRLAEALLGDSISANMLMLGYVWQLGGIPLTLDTIEQAITLNGKAVSANLKAFAAGRRAAVSSGDTPPLEAPPTLETFVQIRTADLTRYWNQAYAARYAALVDAARRAAAALAGGDDLVWAVARAAYKLMAYKDEYEVARLYADGRFGAALSREFQDVRALRFHLAPPLFAPMDPHTGLPRKITVGGWVMPVFRLLAALKGLREGPFDLFGRTPERRLERSLRDTYLAVMENVIATVTADTLDAAVAVAGAPLDVRGYGHVKAPSAEALLARLTGLLPGVA